MSSPMVEDDAIRQLRAERPEVRSRPVLTFDHPRNSSPDRWFVRRPRRAFMLAGVAALLLVLTGIVATDRSGSDTGGPVGISSAEAKQIAFDSLVDLAGLDDYEATNESTFTERDGANRTDRSHTTYRVEGDARYMKRTWGSDFLDREDKGIGKLCIEDYCYEEANSTRIAQPWLLVATHRGGSSRLSYGGDPLASPPDFRKLIDALEREQLVDARRDEDGTVTVTIETPATRLAPIGESFNRTVDPVTGFAGMIVSLNARGPEDTAGARKATVSVTITVSEAGLRTISAHGSTARMVFPNGKGGSDPIPANVDMRWTWKPITIHSLLVPDPHDVMVVGSSLGSRKGVKGVYGTYGTLDTISDARLQQIERDIRRTRNAVASATQRRATAPAPRSYPKLWQRESRALRELRAELDREWLPIDRSKMSTSDRCTPFWPDTLRRMDKDIADADPESAGWKCTTSDGRSSFSVAPDERVLTVNQRFGSGIRSFNYS